jgi:ABC-type transport system involved in multi-copper enzyme maturation permease subunit
MSLKLKWSANPILVKELRSRMRGGRAFATLTGVLLLLGGMSYALFRMVLATTQNSGTPVSPQIGQTLFTGLAFLELMMVCGITPAVTAGAISSEQEKLTYEMLLATPLRPASILWGKLVSALSYVFLLLFAAVPMASLVFIFGGVTLRDMVKAMLVLIVVAVMLGVLGLFMSALFRRSGRATVVSYAVVLGLLFGPLFLALASSILHQNQPPRWLLVPSPISALFSVLNPAALQYGGGNLFYLLGGQFWGLVQTPISQTGIPRPIYHYSVPAFIGLTLVLYLVSTRLVLPAHRWRLKWREVLLAAGMLLGFSGLVAGAFALTWDRYERISLFNQPSSQPQPVKPYPMPAVIEPPAVALPAVAYPLPKEQVQDALQRGMALPSMEQGSIYAAVALQLLEVDHGMESPPDPPAVYLVAKTDDKGGSAAGAPQSDPQSIPQEVQEVFFKLTSAANNNFKWIQSFDDVPLTDNGEVKGGGVIITLGNIYVQEDGSAAVTGWLFYSATREVLKTYTLTNENGVWTVNGSSG